MLAVLTIAIIPLCRLCQIPGTRTATARQQIAGSVLFDWLAFSFTRLPADGCSGILKIPLWVVQAFVPDVFLTIIVSAVLLLAVGFLKGGILWAHKKTIRTREVSGGGH